MIKAKSTPNKEILRRLERIEGILVHFIMEEKGLTEKEVLAIIEEGEKEFKKGKTIDFDQFIASKFPELV